MELNRSRVTARMVMKVRVPIFTSKFKLQLTDCSKCSVSSLAVSVCLSLTVCVGFSIMRIPGKLLNELHLDTQSRHQLHRSLLLYSSIALRNLIKCKEMEGAEETQLWSCSLCSLCREERDPIPSLKGYSSTVY